MIAFDTRSPGTCPRLPGVLVAACAASLGLSACERPDTTSDAHVDALPRFLAEPGTRIGDVDDPDVGFSFPRAADVDRDGNLYVVEASVPEIRVYGSGAALLRRMGARGDGPGEFRRISRFGVLGDTVWTFELGPNRITFFDREGNVRETGRTDGVTVPLPHSYYGTLVPWVMRPDGRFMSFFARFGVSPDAPPSGVRPGDSIPVPLVLFDASGAVTDTIGWSGRPPPRMWRPSSEGESGMEFIEIGGRRHVVPGPPSVLPDWQPLGDGYLVIETPLAQTTDDGEILVTRFGLSGDTVYHRVLEYRPVRYAAAELDTIAARTARGELGGIVRPGGGRPSVPDNWEGIAASLRSAMSFPEFKPPTRYTWVSQDEAVWLRRDDETGPTLRWIVLDSEGGARGVVELPSNVRLLWNRDDTVWVAEPDEYDVPWVVRYELRDAP